MPAIKKMHAIKSFLDTFLFINMQIFFVFVSSYDPNDTIIGDHLIKHGDGIKDIAFEVEQLDNIVKVRARLFCNRD